MRKLFLLIFLFSCSTQQKYSLTRMTTPEVSGGATSRFELGAAETIALVASPNLVAETIDDSPTLKASKAVTFKNDFGVTDFLNLEVSTGPGQAFLSTVKVQILGSPTKSAAQGNFSLGARVGYGLLVTGGSFEAEEIEGSNAAKRSFILESGYRVVDIMVGYRLLAGLLIYTGYFSDSGRYNLKFKKGVRNSLINEIEADGISFGLQYQVGNLLLNLSMANGELEIKEENEVKRAFDIGLSLGFLY